MENEKGDAGDRKDKARQLSCGVCDAKFADQYTLLCHQTEHTALMCSLCRQIFSNVKLFAQHQNDEHGYFICYTCKQPCKSQGELDRHQEAEHASVSTNSSVLHTPRHVQDEHGRHKEAENLYGCNVCSRSFKTKISLLQHKADCHHAKVHCTASSQVFSARKDLTEHEADQRKQKFICTTCALVFPDEDELVRHRGLCDTTLNSVHGSPSELPPANVVCEICSEKFSSKVTLSQHQIAKHGVYLDAGNEKFNDEKTLSNCHSELHNSSCPHCSMSFPSKHALVAHEVEMHKFTCTTCQQVFVDQIKLNEHIRSNDHHLKCDICQCVFLNKELKAKHVQQKHRYSCKICNKLCSGTVKSLASHLLIKHKMPWLCEYCLLTFCSEKALAGHQSEMHKFPCKCCPCFFDNQDALDTHMTQEHRFMCQICKRSYTGDAPLEQHLMAKHNAGLRFAGWGSQVDCHTTADVIQGQAKDSESLSSGIPGTLSVHPVVFGIPEGSSQVPQMVQAASEPASFPIAPTDQGKKNSSSVKPVTTLVCGSLTSEQHMTPKCESLQTSSCEQNLVQNSISETVSRQVQTLLKAMTSPALVSPKFPIPKLKSQQVVSSERVSSHPLSHQPESKTESSSRELPNTRSSGASQQPCSDLLSNGSQSVSQQKDTTKKEPEASVSCDLCDYHISDESELHHHYTDTHKLSKTICSCNSCGKIFITASTLERHVLEVHSPPVRHKASSSMQKGNETGNSKAAALKKPQRNQLTENCQTFSDDKLSDQKEFPLPQQLYEQPGNNCDEGAAVEEHGMLHSSQNNCSAADSGSEDCRRCLIPQRSSQTVQTSCNCCKQKGDKAKDIKSEARLSCSNEQVLNHKGSIQQHAHDNRNKAIKLAPPSTVSRQSELSSCRMQKQQHQQHKLDSEIRHTQCKKDFKKSMLLGQNNTRELLPQMKEDEHDHTNCHDRSTQTSSFQCSQCEICFPWKSELQHHKKSQHRVSSGRAVRCVRCCLTFRDKSKLENHRNSQSCRKSVPSNYCMKCGLTCKDDDMLQQHMRGKHKKKAQLMCSRCKKTFREAEALERHQRDKHGFHIPDDGMRIPGNISLKAKGLSLCQVCGRLFTHKDDLQQHCRDKHADVDVTNVSVLSPCQVCWRIFTQVDDLDEHYRDRHEKEDVKKTSSNAGLTDSAIPETITHAHSINWGSLLKQKADNLTTYMEMHLQPTDECNDGISSIITEMLTYLQGYTKICRYIKAGCLGQGIHLLNSVDVKLLLFLEDFNSLEDMRHNLWTKIQGIKEHLLSSLKWNNEFDVEAITLCSLKLRSKPSANYLCTIELLPTCDVLGSHPSDEKKEEMFYKMLEENVSNWKFYSAVFTQLRVKFFQALPPRVRDLIRVVKHWKDCHLSAEISKAKNQTAPSSYALALITIDTWEEVGEPVTFSVVQGFKAVLQRLVDYESIDIEWYHNYSEDIAEKTRKNGLLSLSRPLVVDPGNPTLNVCADCNRWGEVAMVAWESLQEPLLQGTVIKPDWTA